MPRKKTGPETLTIMRRTPAGKVKHMREKLARAGMTNLRELAERTDGRIGHARINRILDESNTEIDGEDIDAICEAMNWDLNALMAVEPDTKLGDAYDAVLSNLRSQLAAKDRELAAMEKKLNELMAADTADKETR